MVEYQNFLNELRKQFLTGTADELIKSPKKFTFITDDIKTLNYKQKSNINVVEKKDEDNQIDYKKLIKYSKKNVKGKRNKVKDHLSHEIQSQQDNLIQNAKDNFINNTNFLKVENGNTIQIVKNEIINSMFIDDIFNKKRQALEDYMKINELPKIGDYREVPGQKRNIK